jgi:subtilase family serine protease
LSVSRLAPGASRTLTFTGLPAGSAASKTFRAFIDARCITAESNEDNNQGTRAYQVVPR